MNNRLIDVSRRNNLLCYRPVKDGVIDIPDGSPALDDLLSGETISAQSLMPDALDRPSLVTNIVRKAMENLKEVNSSVYRSLPSEGTSPQ